MLMTEWKTTEFGKVQRAEGFAEGYAESYAEGYAEGCAEGLALFIDSLIKNTGKSFDEAVAMLGLSDEEIAACRPYCQE